MSELNDIIKESLEGLRELGDVNSTIGDQPMYRHLQAIFLQWKCRRC